MHSIFANNIYVALMFKFQNKLKYTIMIFNWNLSVKLVQMFNQNINYFKKLLL